MADRFNVYYNGQEVGTLTLKQQGIYTLASCACRKVTSGIIRLVCIGSRGPRSMGVMMPEGLNLVLGKRMTKSDMGALGICDTARFELMTQLPQEDPVPAAEAAVTGSENTEIKIEQEQRNEGEDMWQTCANPSEIFTDEDISHACRNVQGSLTRKQEDILLFAVPLRRDAPFPMMPVFCFGQWEKINGEEYVIFKVKNGQLIV